MTEAALRALESLLRRVLRSPVPGLDAARRARVAEQIRVRGAQGRARRRGAVAALLALGLLVLLLGWFLGRRSVG